MNEIVQDFLDRNAKVVEEGIDNGPICCSCGHEFAERPQVGCAGFTWHVHRFMQIVDALGGIIEVDQ